MEEAATYVALIVDRMRAKWPELRGQLVASYGDHVGLSEDDANVAEAILAAVAIGLQTLDRTVEVNRATQLRSAVRDVVVDRFGTDDAAIAVDHYEELWQRTNDPRGLGMGFIMSVLGEDPASARSDPGLILYKTERILGGAIIETAVGAWEQTLGEKGE
jgi:hypothetical protein